MTWNIQSWSFISASNLIKYPVRELLNCCKCFGRLDSQVVFTLDFWTLVCYALGHEFEPRWCQTLFWTQAQHLSSIHNSVWFVWFDAIICLSNLSHELWNRKLKIKEIFFKQNLNFLQHWNNKSMVFEY